MVSADQNLSRLRNSSEPVRAGAEVQSSGTVMVIDGLAFFPSRSPAFSRPVGWGSRSAPAGQRQSPPSDPSSRRLQAGPDVKRMGTLPLEPACFPPELPGRKLGRKGAGALAGGFLSAFVLTWRHLEAHRVLVPDSSIVSAGAADIASFWVLEGPGGAGEGGVTDRESAALPSAVPGFHC